MTVFRREKRLTILFRVAFWSVALTVAVALVLFNAGNDQDGRAVSLDEVVPSEEIFNESFVKELGGGNAISPQVLSDAIVQIESGLKRMEARSKHRWNATTYRVELDERSAAKDAQNSLELSAVLRKKIRENEETQTTGLYKVKEEMRTSISALLGHIQDGFDLLGKGLHEAIATEAHDNSTFTDVLTTELQQFESVHNNLLAEAQGLKDLIGQNHRDEQAALAKSAGDLD
mmetsp:Transcript_45039/g.119788  ORF Transcript_45039/g.119788 Transcript_45039/m.119788 type:complete len:231 (-) Transcript_45039:42-734(-)